MKTSTADILLSLSRLTPVQLIGLTIRLVFVYFVISKILIECTSSAEVKTNNDRCERLSHGIEMADLSFRLVRDKNVIETVVLYKRLRDVCSSIAKHFQGHLSENFCTHFVSPEHYHGMREKIFKELKEKALEEIQEQHYVLDQKELSEYVNSIQECFSWRFLDYIIRAISVVLIFCAYFVCLLLQEECDPTVKRYACLRIVYWYFTGFRLYYGSNTDYVYTDSEVRKGKLVMLKRFCKTCRLYGHNNKDHGKVGDCNLSDAIYHAYSNNIAYNLPPLHASFRSSCKCSGNKKASSRDDNTRARNTDTEEGVHLGWADIYSSLLNKVDYVKQTRAIDIIESDLVDENFPVFATLIKWQHLPSSATLLRLGPLLVHFNTDPKIPTCFFVPYSNNVLDQAIITLYELRIPYVRHYGRPIQRTAFTSFYYGGQFPEDVAPGNQTDEQFAQSVIMNIISKYMKAKVEIVDGHILLVKGNTHESILEGGIVNPPDQKSYSYQELAYQSKMKLTNREDATLLTKMD